MAERKRNLTNSQARWEAVCLIAAAATEAVDTGSVSGRAEFAGWTQADAIAIEGYVHDRVDGLLRRPRKGATDGG